MNSVGHRRYVAVLLPFDKSFKIDEEAYRRYVRYFADDPRPGICRRTSGSWLRCRRLMPSCRHSSSLTR